MSVITINTEISFSIDDIEDADIDHEFRKRSGLFEKLKTELVALDPASLSDFSTSQLLEEVEDRDADFMPWIERAYRLIAEGNGEEALDLIYREYGGGLADPYTEKRTAALLTGNKGSPNVRN